MTETNAFNIEVEGHTFYAHREYDYVVIDGQRIGGSATFDCRYDKDKNAFVWYCIEDREFVVYEYALDQALHRNPAADIRCCPEEIGIRDSKASDIQ